jgi:hypothetical protein
MKIKFRQTGGFAGLAKSAEVDVNELPPDAAQAVQAIVEEKPKFSVPAMFRWNKPDEEQYQITVEAPGQSRQLHMTRSSVPAPLKSLVNHLAQQATYEKR